MTRTRKQAAINPQVSIETCIQYTFKLTQGIELAEIKEEMKERGYKWGGMQWATDTGMLVYFRGKKSSYSS